MTKYVIDTGVTARDSVIDPAAFEKFLLERIKVDNKKGNLGSKVAVAREGNKVSVSTKDGEGSSKHKDHVVSKRYIKYLTKKYLKKNEIRDYIRVIASGKLTYELRYFKTGEEAEAE